MITTDIDRCTHHSFAYTYIDSDTWLVSINFECVIINISNLGQY